MPGAISEFLDAERVVVALRELQRGAREPGLNGGNVECAERSGCDSASRAN
jgi:hypothetical protein